MEHSNQHNRHRKIQKLLLLCRGRFIFSEVKSLLAYCKENCDHAASLLLKERPEDLRRKLRLKNVKTHYDDFVSNNYERGRTRMRQFGCAECDTVWWRRVPARKPVSKCRRCKKKFDAIPRDQEYGWANFICECGNEFTGFGAMGQTLSACYVCRKNCSPLRIIPPTGQGPRKKISEKSHSCSGKNCYRRNCREVCWNERSAYQNDLTITVKGEDNCVCAHPRSDTRRVIVPSMLHVSTGSTVDSYLDTRYHRDDFYPSLSPIESDSEI